MKNFLNRLQDPCPLLYDGGFGTELFSRGILLANSSIANVSYPEDVIAVHSSYIEAGSEAIGTNTFVASALHLKMVDNNTIETETIVRFAVELAHKAVKNTKREIYIGGTIGPSPGAIEADSGGVDFGFENDLVRNSHRRMAQTMAESGVDFICIETMFSANEAAIAVDEARKTGLPIAVNMTYKFTQNRHNGEIVYRTDWGHSAKDLLKILSSGDLTNGDNLLNDIQLLGLNCGAESRHINHTGMPYAINGTQQLKLAMEEIGIDKKIMSYPNAGMPLLDKNHITHYPQTALEMAYYLPDLLDKGTFFIGGCCGTTPAHIKAFRKVLNEYM